MIFNSEQNEINKNETINVNNESIDATTKSTNVDYKKKMYQTRNIVMNTSSKKTISLNNLETMLETERNNNDNETWTKLSKTIKLKKLIVYASVYKLEHNLSDNEQEKLILFFKDCLDKKKLQRVKDVDYNRETGEIVSIPALIHNKNNHNFTLKNIYKKVITAKCLSSQKKNKMNFENNNLSEILNNDDEIN